MADTLTADTRAARLERALTAALALARPQDVPAKLGLAPAAWDALLACLDDGGPAPSDVAATLATVHQALQRLGRAEALTAPLAGMRFGLEAAGVRWARRLGPTSPEREAFDHALGKLRWETCGLTLARRVEIAGVSVDWAVAGLLPTGKVVRLAVQVRPEPTPLAALAEDFLDDMVAAAGFEMLGFREWQLRYPGACALHVAAAVAAVMPGFVLPAKLTDPDDDHPIQRAQSAPVRLTPRASRPHWALRQALRAAHPDGGLEALLGPYHDGVVAATRATAEGEEWTISG